MKVSEIVIGTMMHDQSHRTFEQSIHMFRAQKKVRADCICLWL